MANPVLFMDRGMLVLRFAGCAAAFAMDEPAVFFGTVWSHAGKFDQGEFK